MNFSCVALPMQAIEQRPHQGTVDRVQFWACKKSLRSSNEIGAYHCGGSGGCRCRGLQWTQPKRVLKTGVYTLLLSLSAYLVFRVDRASVLLTDRSKRHQIRFLTHVLDEAKEYIILPAIGIIVLIRHSSERNGRRIVGHTQPHLFKHDTLHVESIPPTMSDSWQYVVG